MSRATCLGRQRITERLCGDLWFFARPSRLAGLRAIYEPFALILGQLRQRVQFHALIERCPRDSAEVVAEGFAARGRHPDGALALPGRIRSGGGEAIRWSGNIFHSSRVLVRPAFVSGRSSS